MVLRPIPAERPATRILTIVSDERGRIWGSSGFGQTIFRYDPPTGEVWNSQVVCDSGGEVFGMAFAGGKLFMSAYSGGDHIVYDPAQPWDQVGNANPRTLEPVKPALIRPSAKSAIGPDGNFWTGWMAGYGVYGGGLTRVDTGTLAMTCWYDPVPGQTIGGLAADDRFLYFITSANANGLPDHQEPLRFVVFAPDGRIVWQQHFQLGQKLHGVCAVAGRALVAVDSELLVFDPAGLRFERSIQLDQACQCLVRWDSDSAAVFCGDEVWRVEPLAGQATRVCDVPEPPSTATVAPDGALYFASGMNLYRLKA